MAAGQDKIGLSEKDETIGRLYALRAGLSVVAREKEKADGIVNSAYDDKRHTIDIANHRIDAATRVVSDIRDKYVSMINHQDELRARATSQGLFTRIIAYLFCAIFWLPLLANLAYGVSIICCWCDAFGKDWEKNPLLSGLYTWTTYAGMWALVAVVIVAVVLFFFGGGFTYLIIKPIKFSYSNRKRARNELVGYDSQLQRQKGFIDNAEEDLINAQKQKTIDTAAADADIAKAKKEATEHAVAGLVMINALEDSFGDMIDSRDWENTDILIYALETRRAENMKEALSVVDGERRTERIVEAVNTAGQEICKSINTGLRRLQGEMTRCFGVLGELVVLQGDRIAGHMQSLSNGIAASNSYMAQLTSQQSMSNALLAKANENSSALTAEVSRLRTAAEYAEARSLYGTR